MMKKRKHSFCCTSTGPQVNEVQVEIRVACPGCSQEITPSEGESKWTIEDVRQVGVFAGFDCPSCQMPLQMPFALFTLHIEPETKLKAVGGRA
jgi:hypothetical protein